MSLVRVKKVGLKLSGGLGDAQARRPFCPPFFMGKTPASMTFPGFQRVDPNYSRSSS